MWLPRASLSLHQRSLPLSRSVWLHCPLLPALPLPALITLGQLVITALLLLDSGYFPLPCGLPSPNLKASSPSFWDPDLYRLFIYILLLPTFLQDYQSNEPKWLLPLFFLEYGAKNLFLQFKLLQKTGGAVVFYTFCPAIIPQARKYKGFAYLHRRDEERKRDKYKLIS